MKGLRIWVVAAEKSADFSLIINAVDANEKPIYSAGSLKVDDPELSSKLRLICQAFRAGQATADQVPQ